MDKKKKELISVRLPTALNKKLARHVSVMGLSKSAFIIGLINNELSKNENDQSAQMIENVELGSA